ncbi:hypothetical protein EBR43_10580 [bacterium]|nr:hypothetical protein [bacterium]
MIKILKLGNGEEIVGEYVPSSNNVTLRKPMTIVYRFHPLSSFPTVKLVKYMLFSKDELFTFSSLDIVNLTDARESFADYYKHVVEVLGDEADKNIDNELKEAIIVDKTAKNKFYESLLEQMPTPKNAN